MKPAKRTCCAILGRPELHKGEDIWICGLLECRRPHPAEGRPLTPYLPLCSSHRALAEVGPVRVYVEESIGEFRL